MLCVTAMQGNGLETTVCPAGGAIAILKFLHVDKLMGTNEVAEGTVLLFAFHGLAAAGFTYCFSFLFKSPSSAQSVTIFLNVRVGEGAGRVPPRTMFLM